VGGWAGIEYRALGGVGCQKPQQAAVWLAFESSGLYGGVGRAPPKRQRLKRGMWCAGCYGCWGFYNCKEC